MGHNYNHFSSRLLEVRDSPFWAKNTEICRGQRPVKKRCELGHNRKSLNAFVEHITFLAVLHLLKKHDLAYLTLARSGCIEFVQLEFRNTVVWVYGVKRLQMWMYFFVFRSFGEFGVSLVTLSVGPLSLLWVLTVPIELSQTVWRVTNSVCACVGSLRVLWIL